MGRCPPQTYQQETCGKSDERKEKGGGGGGGGKGDRGEGGEREQEGERICDTNLSQLWQRSCSTLSVLMYPFECSFQNIS